MNCTYPIANAMHLFKESYVAFMTIRNFFVRKHYHDFFLAENHARQTKTMLNSTRPDQLRSVASFTCYCKPINNFNIFAFFFLQANQTKIRV